ncbi:MAG TPA: DNA-binding protein [Firmicutes bacterium]|nr:DNA-binding protein [Bacillota bacterium]
MEKNVRMCMLLDSYSPLLTQKQRECMQLYYEEDLSLSEISELLGISRQGVRDCLKKAENTLEHMEKELGLLRNSLRLERLLDRLRELKLPEVDELIAQFKQASEDDNGI